AVVHRYRPESIYRRKLSLGECEGVVVLAGIEGLSSAVVSSHGIRRFGGVVGIDAGLCNRSAFQPVAVEVRAVAPSESADLPAVDVFTHAGDCGGYFPPAVLHAQ